MGEINPPTRFVLRRLPMSARIAVSAFLLSVGLGYLAALVQMHYQHAQRGELLPTPDDAVKIFHGVDGRPVPKMEQMIDAPEGVHWPKQMRSAFCNDESGDRAKKTGNQKVIDEREGERLAVLAWLRAGGQEEPWVKDRFVLPGDWKKDQPLTQKMQADDGKAVKVRSIIEARCARCHQTEAPDDATASAYPLTNWKELKSYVQATKTGPSMSITKLAQTSHVHMLGFAMLYGLTGILLAFTTYPGVVRVFLCPLPLVVQAADIACWWLARLDAPYGVWAAKTIPITGGIVAAGVMAHIMLTLFDLYDGAGKVVLLLLLGGAGAGGFVCLKPVIEKEIDEEKAKSVLEEKKDKDDPSKKKDEENKDKETKDK